MTEQLSQEKQISKLKKQKGRIEKGLEIAEKFVQNKTEELEQIDKELGDNTFDDETLLTEEDEIFPPKNEEDDEEDSEDPLHPKKKLLRYKKWIKKG